MKRIVFFHLVSIIGIFILMFGAYVLVDLIGHGHGRVPNILHWVLIAFGWLFLITSGLLWIGAWWVLIRQWGMNSGERNLIAVAALIVGNIFGAYLVLYVYFRDKKLTQRDKG